MDMEEQISLLCDVHNCQNLQHFQSLVVAIIQTKDVELLVAALQRVMTLLAKPSESLSRF